MPYPVSAATSALSSLPTSSDSERETLANLLFSDSESHPSVEKMEGRFPPRKTRSSIFPESMGSQACRLLLDRSIHFIEGDVGVVRDGP